MLATAQGFLFKRSAERKLLKLVKDCEKHVHGLLAPLNTYPGKSKGGRTPIVFAPSQQVTYETIVKVFQHKLGMSAYLELKSGITNRSMRICEGTVLKSRFGIFTPPCFILRWRLDYSELDTDNIAACVQEVNRR